jgi:hypothetical protein
MNTIYKTLFEVVIDHEYYDDNSCNDFIIKPLPETIRLLSRFRLLLRNEINGFRILYQIADVNNKPFLELDEGMTFNFSMHLKNLAFYNFTELSYPSKNEIFQFKNSTSVKTDENETSIDFKIETESESVIQIRPKIFHYGFTSKSDSVRLLIKSSADTPIVDKQLVSHNKDFEEQINLSSFPAGEYSIQTIINEEIEYDQKIFTTNLIEFRKPFGLISIQKDPSIGYEKVSRFHIEFQNKSVPWKYHLKLNKDYNGFDISIVDKENYKLKSSRYRRKLKFVKRDRSDYSKGKTLEFESGIWKNKKFWPKSVPIYETPKKNLRLTISNEIENIMYNHLPNPSINNLKPEVYIYV